MKNKDAAARAACDKCIATMEAILARNAYLRARDTLIEYLLHKVQVDDWHGVRDCAVDIELLEARHSARSSPNKI